MFLWNFNKMVKKLWKKLQYSSFCTSVIFFCLVINQRELRKRQPGCWRSHSTLPQPSDLIRVVFCDYRGDLESACKDRSSWCIFLSSKLTLKSRFLKVNSGIRVNSCICNWPWRLKFIKPVQKMKILVVAHSPQLYLILDWIINSY